MTNQPTNLNCTPQKNPMITDYPERLTHIDPNKKNKKRQLSVLRRYLLYCIGKIPSSLTTSAPTVTTLPPILNLKLEIYQTKFWLPLFYFIGLNP